MNGAASTKWVVMYESAENIAAKAPEHFQSHLERLHQFHARGELLLVGTFADAQADGSMCVFDSKSGAESFVEGDPFLVNGVVRGYRILEWNEMYGL